MSHSTSGSVECPLCGETFDPSAAGGWCTNSDCGEWQYEDAGDTVDEDDRGRDAVGDDSVDGAVGASTTDGDAPPDDVAELFGDDGDDAESDAKDDAEAESGNDTEADAGDGEEADDGAVAEAEADVEAGTDDGVEGDADADSGPVGESGPDAGSDPDSGDDGATGADGSETGDERAEQDLACPSCGEPVDEEDNFCASCGEDVSALEPGPLTECPGCEDDVGPEDNFCTTCGEDLTQYRPSGGGAADRTGSDSAATGDGTAASDGARETTSRADRSVSGAAPIDESLTLLVRNHEIEVWDGDVVGREVRSIIMETGGDEEDAIRVHREHVRFEYERGQFYLVAVGQNPTVVNGERVDQGDRVPVSPGDQVELSKVAKMRVAES